MSAPAAPRCGDCRYFHQTGVAEEGRAPNGECHRYAPGPVDNWCWPYISAGDWCGEFAPKLDLERLEPGPIERISPDGLADRGLALVYLKLAEKIEAGQLDPLRSLTDWLRDHIHLCGHGSIGSTCGLCMRDRGR